MTQVACRRLRSRPVRDPVRAAARPARPPVLLPTGEWKREQIVEAVQASASALEPPAAAIRD